MRGLGLIDLLVIIGVIALLVFAGTRQFQRYESRPTLASTPTAPVP